MLLLVRLALLVIMLERFRGCFRCSLVSWPFNSALGSVADRCVFDAVGVCAVWHVGTSDLGYLVDECLNNKDVKPERPLKELEEDAKALRTVSCFGHETRVAHRNLVIDSVFVRLCF